MPRPEAMNRTLRTRRDLLHAASRLLKSGKEPTMDEIAKEAYVSRATAYRYFSDVGEILLEVGIDDAVPDPKTIFKTDATSSITDRVDRAEAVMHEMIYKNEPQLRLMLSRSIAKPKTGKASKEIPARQNRRAEYIEEALAPHREQFDGKTLKKLTESLALVFGPEAMIVFRDVVPLEADRAREVKRWMLSVLVNAALDESRSKRRTRR